MQIGRGKKKFYWIAGSAVILLFLAGVLIFIFAKQGEIKNSKVCFQEKCFSVEIAETSAQRSRGLMSREHLGKYEGMLFVFEEEGRYGFWMKDTPIPLDIIWINEDKEIVFIANDALPCTQDSCPAINPDVLAPYVLEINAGMAQEIGLTVG